MVIKINNKPLLVKEKDSKNKITPVWIAGMTWTFASMVYAIDYTTHLYLHFHPFGFIKFMGVFYKWFL